MNMFNVAIIRLVCVTKKKCIDN